MRNMGIVAWWWLLSLFIPLILVMVLPRSVDIHYRDGYHPLPRAAVAIGGWLLAVIPLAIVTIRRLLSR